MELGVWMEALLGSVIVFGCGFGIYLYGLWIGKQREKPVGFWSNGKPLEPASVTDISAYNIKLGKLFRIFALPFCVSGVMILFSGIYENLAVVSLVILLLWAVFGIWWLIHQYKCLEKAYILR